jgi:hypothetical protein
MPNRRRLKSATHTYTNPMPAVHDRKATQLPANTVVGVVTVDDPFARGERINAVTSLRDDPLGALWARHQIDDAKYMAGRHWQKLYEAVEIGVRGVDFTRERVDGGSGNGIEIMTNHRRKALEKLTRCSAALGRQGDSLIRDVLGRGLCLVEVAASRGYGTRRGIEYLGQRLRECLETLAHEFGYA